MARMRSARERLFAFAGPTGRSSARASAAICPRPSCCGASFRCSSSAFSCSRCTGFAFQTVQRQACGTRCCAEQLALMADITALNLKDKTLGSSANWQGALAASLPKGATADGRTALLADADGNIQARAPLGGSHTGEPAHHSRPAAAAHHLRRRGRRPAHQRSLDGTDAIVTVRDVPQTDAQLAFIQPVDAALARVGGATRASKSPCSSAPASCSPCLRGGLWYLAPAAARGDDDGARQGADRGTARLRRVALEPRARPRPLVGADVPLARARAFERAPWPSAPSRRRSTPTTISGASSTVICATGLALRSGFPAAPRRRPFRLVAGCAATLHAARPTASLASPASPRSAEQEPLPAIADANARLRDAVETISEAFVLWDHENRLVMCNSKYQQFHGLPDDNDAPRQPL